MKKLIEEYNSSEDLDKEVYTCHGDTLKGSTTIKMLYAYADDINNKDLAEFFLQQIYQVMVEHYEKDEIYERIEEMEKLISNYMKQIKFWE